MNITPLETAILDMIARNLYQPVNGAVPDCYSDTGAIWTMLLTDSKSTYVGTVKPSSFPGIIASLVKKGLVNSYDGGPKREHTLELTPAGFIAWESLQATGKV